MLAFALVPSDAHRAFGIVMFDLAVLVFLAWVGVHAFRFGAMLYRSLMTWNGDAVQGDLFEVGIQDRSGVWRKLLVALFVAFLGSVTLSAFPVDCNSIPWWTIEYWYYCSGR